MSISADDSGVVAGVVRDSFNAAVVGVSVVVTATEADGETVAGQALSGADGKYRVVLPLASGQYSIVAWAGSAASQPALVTVSARLKITASIDAVKSESATQLRIDYTDRDQAVAAQVVVAVQEPTMASPQQVASLTAHGSVRVPVKPWRNPNYFVTVIRKSQQAQVTVGAVTRARFAKPKYPSRAPQPRVAEPVVLAPTGSGANAVIKRIPNSVWNQMSGRSWRPGCVPRSGLRLIEANYRGFDGYRHRGQLIVNAAIAGKARKALTRLYNRGVPIRQMRLVDEYGKNRNGLPGANDYASMAADNTSGFNCRYVVGRESQRARSPHASGRSLDINPWENPYVQGTVYPHRYFLNRSRKAPGQFKPGNAAYQVMRSVGCRWGGTYRDYHHWDC